MKRLPWLLALCSFLLAGAKPINNLDPKSAALQFEDPAHAALTPFSGFLHG